MREQKRRAHRCCTVGGYGVRKSTEESTPERATGSKRQRCDRVRQEEEERMGRQMGGWTVQGRERKKKKTEQHLVLRVLLEFQSLLKKKKIFLIYSFIWKAEREYENVPSVGSLPKSSWQLGFSQAKARSRELKPSPPHKRQKRRHLSCHLLPSAWISRKLDLRQM